MSEANPYIGADTGDKWVQHEVGRQGTMDDFLANFAREDFELICRALANSTPTPERPCRFLDVGAGVGITFQLLCEARGAHYFSLDINPDILTKRPDINTRVRGRSEDLPFQDGAFDITLSRAVSAWSQNPRDAIAEQLRVTREGGLAAFSEFDWSHSGATDWESPVYGAYKQAQAIIMLTLDKIGFRPNFGAELGDTVEEVASYMGVCIKRSELRHEPPIGHYRDFFLEHAENILIQLRQSGNPKSLVPASLLDDAISKIKRETAPCSLRLPALVTHMIIIDHIGNCI